MWSTMSLWVCMKSCLALPGYSRQTDRQTDRPLNQYTDILCVFKLCLILLCVLSLVSVRAVLTTTIHPPGEALLESGEPNNVEHPHTRHTSLPLIRLGLHRHSCLWPLIFHYAAEYPSAKTVGHILQDEEKVVCMHKSSACRQPLSVFNVNRVTVRVRIRV